MIVPRYQEHANTQAMPQVRVSTQSDLAAFGGGAAVANADAAHRGLIDQATKIAAKAQEDADSARVLDSASSTMDFKNRLVDDPKDGIKTKRGKNALDKDLVKNALLDYDRFADETEKSLSRNQREMYSKLRSKFRADLETDASSHLVQESKKYGEESAIRATSSAQMDAIANPARVQDSIRMQSIALRQLQKSQDRGEDWYNEAFERAKSYTHSAIVKRYLDDSKPEAAAAYLKANSEFIQKDDRSKLKAPMDIASARGRAIDRAGEIMKDFPDDKAEAESKAKEADSSGKTLAELQRMWKDAEEMKHKDHQEKVRVAYSAASAGKDIPPTLEAQLNSAEIKALNKIAEHKRKGTEPETDTLAYLALKELAAKDPAAFLKRDPHLFEADFSGAEASDLNKIWIGIKSNDEKTKKGLSGFLSNRQYVSGIIRPLGIKKARADKFQEMVHNQVEQIQTATGKKVDTKQLREIVDELLIVGDYGMFGKNRRAFEVDDFDKFEPHISFEDRDMIKQVLREKKQDVTEENIVKYYKAVNK